MLLKSFVPCHLLCGGWLGRGLSGWLLAITTALLPTLAQAAESTPEALRARNEASSALLQGDANAAVKVLRAVPAAQFQGTAARDRACVLGRFDRATPPALPLHVQDPFTRQVVWAYQDHWWHALKAPQRRDALEVALLQRLRRLVGLPPAAKADFDSVKAPLLQRLQAAGYHALPADRTPPLQELMLWRRDDVREERVELPEGVQSVRLDVLDEFVVRGWSAYARCDHGSTGGWANDDGIFAVKEAYRDLQDEHFRVTLLGHEAQHVADYQRFPGLQPWELEFRAKLVELSMADTIRPLLLHHFEALQSDNTDSPHTYANRRVILALRDQLSGELKGEQPLVDVPGSTLRAAARAALLADSARRAATTTPPTLTP